MPESTATEAGTNGLAKIEKVGTLAAFRELLETIPTVDEDPTESMIAAVLASPDPAKWEETFTAAHFKDSASRQFRVHTFRASPSQYEGRLPVFLLLDVTDLKTGERTVLTCGSEMAVAQMLNAWKLGAFPIDVEVHKKDKPTKAGYYPMRFKYLGRPGAPLGDPSAVVAEQ